MNPKKVWVSSGDSTTTIGLCFSSSMHVPESCWEKTWYAKEKKSKGALIAMVLFKTQEENHLLSPPPPPEKDESRMVSSFKYVWVWGFFYHMKTLNNKICYTDENGQSLLNYRCLKLEPCRNSIYDQKNCPLWFFKGRVPARLSNFSLPFFPWAIRKRAFMTNDCITKFLPRWFFYFVYISPQYIICSFTCFVFSLLENTLFF